jgi:hypothetical protein
VQKAENALYRVQTMIEEANLPKNRMWSRRPAEERRLLTVHIQRVEHLYALMIIGRICVQNDLPAGDPCWMAKFIGSFVGFEGTGGYEP